MRQPFKIVGPILVLVLALLVVGSIVIRKGENAYHQLEKLYPLPEFVLYENDDSTFTNEDLSYKLTIVDFIFTHCQGPCPTMAVEMKALYEEFSAAPQIQFLSISVDPERDTFDVLQNYGRSLGVNDDRWKFVRNDLPVVADLCENGFKLAAENLPYGHTVKFILVDHEGYIRGYYDGTNDVSMANLRKHIMAIIEDVPVNLEKRAVRES